MFRFVPPLCCPVAVLLAGGVALADEPAPAQTSSRVKLSGFVDVYYDYNTNQPVDGSNFTTNTGTTAKRANTFSLNQGVVDLTIDPAPVGVHLAVGLGTGLQVVHSGEPFGLGIGQQVWQNVVTATVSGRLPIGRGLLIEGGVYPSHIGLETFYSKDNWNYTRSWMGEYSPYYQTGIKASYSFGDVFAAQLHVVNGWEVIGQNWLGKAVGVQLAWTWKKASFTVNTFDGPEPTGTTTEWRNFVDTILVLKPTDAFNIGASVDFGSQRLPAPQPASDWVAGMLLLRYAVTPKLAVAGRGEIYRDNGGVITGTRQTLTEGTATLEYRPVDMLILKLEGRYDHSTAPVFSGRGEDDTPAFTNHEVLALLGAVTTF